MGWGGVGWGTVGWGGVGWGGVGWCGGGWGGVVWGGVRWGGVGWDGVGWGGAGVGSGGVGWGGLLQDDFPEATLVYMGSDPPGKVKNCEFLNICSRPEVVYTNISETNVRGIALSTEVLVYMGSCPFRGVLYHIKSTVASMTILMMSIQWMRRLPKGVSC